MRLTLTDRKAEARGVESFRFEPQEKLAWKAGQFLHYVLHHEPTDDRGSDRWFTVASAPSEHRVMLTTRFSDDKGSTFKKALRDLKIGDSVEVSDVDGDFVVDDADGAYVFIAGGIGITPFRSMLKEMHAEGKRINVTLLYANRDESIPYREELESIAEANPNLRIHYVISPERIDENKIKRFVSNLREPLFYVSGPEPMVESLGQMLKAMGVPEGHIKQDWFPGYPAE